MSTYQPQNVYDSCTNYGECFGTNTNLSCCWEYKSYSVDYNNLINLRYELYGGYNQICDYASGCSAHSTNPNWFYYYVWIPILIVLIILRICRIRQRS